jgi:type II secretory pathway pseudopilin PulG
METAMMKAKTKTRQAGFALMEVLFTIVVLTVGLCGMLAMFTVALASTNSTQEDLHAKQEAAETLESIFTARNTSQITWNDIQNVANGGKFMDGPQRILDPGPDGLAGTADDLNANAYCPGPSQCLIQPGPDGILGTADDVLVPMNNYQRTITIADVLDPSGALDPTLRQITVTIQYTTTQFKATNKTYSIGGYISQFR